MNILKVIVILFSISLLVACVTYPVTPSDMRAMAEKGKMFSSTETIVVNRSFAAVVKTIKSRALQCLKGSVEITTRKGLSKNIQQHYYTPTVKYHKGSAEIHLQKRVEGIAQAASNKDKIRANGWFILVADFTKLNNGKTKVDIYHTPGLTLLIETIQNWANGSSKACPDLSQLPVPT